jgi:hypothetical protein
MTRFVSSVIALTLISSTVLGGALDTKVVGGDASWVAHVDVEAIQASELGKMFLAAAEQKERFAKGVESIKEYFGCDPLKDIRGITVYGPRLGQRDAVVVADATVASDTLITALKEKESYKSEKYRQHAIHQWTDKKKHSDKTEERYACFYDKKTVVFATDIKRLKSALDVLDGESDNLAKTNSIEALPKAAEGAFFVLGANTIAFPEGRARRGAMLRRVSAVSMQGGESDCGVFVNASVVAGSEKDAVNMRMFVQGILALSEMTRQQEKFAQLQDLGEKIKVSGAGKDVSIAASMPVKSVLRILAFIDENRAAIKSRKRAPKTKSTEKSE